MTGRNFVSRSTTDLKKLRKESRKSARRAGKKMAPVASDARDSAAEVRREHP